MRYITIPSNVEVCNPLNSNEKVVNKFCDWMMYRVLLDPKWGQTADLILKSVSLQNLFNNCEPGQTVKVSDESWLILKNIVNEPSIPYETYLFTKIYSFLSAVLLACNEEPV